MNNILPFEALPGQNCKVQVEFEGRTVEQDFLTTGDREQIVTVGLAE